MKRRGMKGGGVGGVAISTDIPLLVDVTWHNTHLAFPWLEEWEKYILQIRAEHAHGRAATYVQNLMKTLIRQARTVCTSTQ